MFINFLFAAIKAGTPLLLGTTGEILTERSGNLNLGVEGMMYMGAISGFYAGFYTGNVLLALLAAAGAGALGALIYAFLTVTLKANQNVTGLTLTIFGTGFANFFGEILISRTPAEPPSWQLPFRTPLPSAPSPCSGTSRFSASCSFPTTHWCIWRSLSPSSAGCICAAGWASTSGRWVKTRPRPTPRALTSPWSSISTFCWAARSAGWAAPISR